jgi:hypothetical protein
MSLKSLIWKYIDIANSYAFVCRVFIFDSMQKAMNPSKYTYVKKTLCLNQHKHYTAFVNVWTARANL